jgi:hypothetical protein
MKKIILGLLMLVGFYSNAQEYKLEEKSVIGVFEANGKTKAEIFSAINKWISINYNSSKTVVQLSDAEGGNIVVKGINEAKCKNNTKVIMPNAKIDEYSVMKFNHLIEINIKDNKFRIIYKITDYVMDIDGYENIKNMTFKGINFNGVDDTSIAALYEFSEQSLKDGLVGKEKRDRFLSLLKPTYEELNANIIANIKVTMESIAKSTTVASDGW